MSGAARDAASAIVTRQWHSVCHDRNCDKPHATNCADDTHWRTSRQASGGAKLAGRPATTTGAQIEASVSQRRGLGAGGARGERNKWLPGRSSGPRPEAEAKWLPGGWWAMQQCRGRSRQLTNNEPEQLAQLIGQTVVARALACGRELAPQLSLGRLLLVGLVCLVPLVGQPAGALVGAKSLESPNQPGPAAWLRANRFEARNALSSLQVFVRPLISQYFELKLRMQAANEEQLDGAQMSALEPPQARHREQMQLIESDLGLLAERLANFHEQATVVLGMKDFCVYSVIKQAHDKLRPLAAGSRILGLVYDLIMIEFHESCLTATIARLPQVPYLVRDVVKLYVDGAAKRVPDLNGQPSAGLFPEDADEEPAFEVERAIRLHGSLDQVVGLLLTVPQGEPREQVRAFKEACKSFLIDIEKEWQSLYIMNQLLANEANKIKRTNNWILRRLVPTKYADICSQLSAATDSLGHLAAGPGQPTAGPYYESPMQRDLAAR